jgi:cytochrome c556
MAVPDLAKTCVAMMLAAGLAALAGGAVAQGAGAKAAMDRHDHFKTMGKAFKVINDELKKDAPDKTLIASDAARVKAMAAQLPTWFPKGSGQAAYPKSKALPEIWSDPSGFSAAAASLKTETAKLSQIAAAGDLDAIRVQTKATGQACGGCHKKYREKDD